MLAAIPVKKNRVNRNTNISSTKCVTRKLKEVSRFSRAKQRKGNVQKSVLHEQSCFLANQKKSVLYVQSCFLANQKKSVLHVQSCCCCCFFLLIRSIAAVFTALVVFTLSLILLDFIFIFSLRKLSILQGASLSALAKSIYYHYYTTFQTNMLLRWLRN